MKQSSAKEDLESIHVNLPTHPQFPTTICTDGSKAAFQPLKPEACETASTSIFDTGGAEGKLITKVSTGYETSTTFTESTSTVVGAGLGVSLKTNFLVAGTDLGINPKIKYTRHEGSSTTLETDSSVSSTREVNVKDGSQCSITTQARSCKYNAQGQYPVLAFGYVHFKYKNKPQMSMVKIDDFPLDLRSVWISVQVAIDTKMDVGVTAICKNRNQKPNIPVSGTAPPQKLTIPVSGTADPPHRYFAYPFIICILTCTLVATI